MGNKVKTVQQHDASGGDVTAVRFHIFSFIILL